MTKYRFEVVNMYEDLEDNANLNKVNVFLALGNDGSYYVFTQKVNGLPDWIDEYGRRPGWWKRRSLNKQFHRVVEDAVTRKKVELLQRAVKAAKEQQAESEKVLTS